MNAWKNPLTLNSDRTIRDGSAEALASSIRRGADLRIYTDFRHNEHIDVLSKNPELVGETSDFRVTYLLENRWVAGIMTLRQPVDCPDGFGPRPSMSFFLYNQDGQQAVARPHLDGPPADSPPGSSLAKGFPGMSKYHAQDNWDEETNAPSHNFIYDFGVYRFWALDVWREVLAHDAQGRVMSGSWDALTEAFMDGCEFKVGVRGVCDDFSEKNDAAIEHEMFVQCGSAYCYTERKLFFAETHPVVRVRPAIPMRYESRNWDFGWLMARSDGVVKTLLYDPYSLKYRRGEKRLAVRWFAR